MLHCLIAYKICHFLGILFKQHVLRVICEAKVVPRICLLSPLVGWPLRQDDVRQFEKRLPRLAAMYSFDTR